jgi:predicted O-methyltransferase YrrM
VLDEHRALLDENRRLRKDVRLLRERVEAFERSRWWRLHPRFLLPTRVAAVDEGDAAAPSAEFPKDDSVVRRLRDEILSGGTFTRDDFTRGLAELDSLVAPLAGRAVAILEIGSFEGLSASYFLWRLPNARVTCVDIFGGGLEATFDANVERIDATRVRKIVGDSRRVLLDLVNEAAQYELVYVDGSHHALDVVVDTALSWRVLRPGGTMVFDDYRWNDDGDDALLRPGPAIDAMLSLLEGKHELLARGDRVAIRKL